MADGSAPRQPAADGVQTKALALHVKAAGNGTPDDAQLAAIRPYTLRDFAADELVVREYIVAHTGIDRDKECFAPGLLDDFARTLPGKGVYIKHPLGWDGSTGPAEGRIFAASTERMGIDAAKALLREPSLVFPPDAVDATLLRVSAYYVRTPENTGFLAKLDAGIAVDVSIGFSAKTVERLKDQNGLELNAWRWVGPGEGFEMSHVWLGAQPGARAVKHANRKPDHEEPTMDEAQIKALQGENAQLKQQLADAQKTATALEAVRKALGDDHAKLIDTPDALAKAVRDGADYRKALLDDVIAAERQLGITGDDAAAIKNARDLYDALPTERLKALGKRYEAQLPTGGAQTKGDPNRSNATKGAPPAALEDAAI